MADFPGLVFDPVPHIYRYEGVAIPSVTQILQVLGGYEGIPALILKKAAERGTEVHRVTELHDLGTLDYASVHEDIIPYFMSYERFLADKRPEIVAVEDRVFNPTLRYAGTLDREVVMDGKRGVLDLKATYQLMPATAPQTAAYFEAVNCHRKKAEKLTHRWSLKLAKTGEYELTEYKDHAADFNVFKAALVIRNWKTRNTKH